MVLVTGVLLLLGLALVAPHVAREIGRPVLYRLPGDYRGWAANRFEDPGCAPLTTHGWYLAIPIAANGRGCASSPVPAGWRYVRYEYVYPDRGGGNSPQPVWRSGRSG